MVLGNLNTTKTWVDLLAEVADELRKWGIRDYIPPTLQGSRRDGCVTLQLAREGVWFTISCSAFGRYPNGPERNLCAIREALRSVRLAEQRGIGQVFHQAAQILALPEPRREV